MERVTALVLGISFLFNGGTGMTYVQQKDTAKLLRLDNLTAWSDAWMQQQEHVSGTAIIVVLDGKVVL
jgi:hypothetical protein